MLVVHSKTANAKQLMQKHTMDGKKLTRSIIFWKLNSIDRKVAEQHGKTKNSKLTCTVKIIILLMHYICQITTINQKCRIQIGSDNNIIFFKDHSLLF